MALQESRDTADANAAPRDAPEPTGCAVGVASVQPSAKQEMNPDPNLLTWARVQVNNVTSVSSSGLN